MNDTVHVKIMYMCKPADILRHIAIKGELWGRLQGGPVTLGPALNSTLGLAAESTLASAEPNTVETTGERGSPRLVTPPGYREGNSQNRCQQQQT